MSLFSGSIELNTKFDSVVLFQDKSTQRDEDPCKGYAKEQPTLHYGWEPTAVSFHQHQEKNYW